MLQMVYSSVPLSDGPGQEIKLISPGQARREQGKIPQRMASEGTIKWGRIPGQDPCHDQA